MSNSDMESPPSFSTQSEPPPLSEDSGLLISSGSFSSDSASGWHRGLSELQESDCDEKSLSYADSSEASGRHYGDNYNTVKKGKPMVPMIEPPPQFQDHPILLTITRSKSVDLPENESIEECRKNTKLASLEIPVPGRNISPLYAKKLKHENFYERRQCFSPRYLWSPGRGARPNSRSSLSSRFSSSHNSLVTQLPADDSSFITQAISHDALSAPRHPIVVGAAATDIADLYNVPFDSDIYALPIDSLQSTDCFRTRGKKALRSQKKRKSTPASYDINTEARNYKCGDSIILRHKELKSKRHRLQSDSVKKTHTDSDSEALHVTLRKYLQTFYSSSSDSESKITSKHKYSTSNKIQVHSKYNNHLGNQAPLKEINESDSGKIIEKNNNSKNTKILNKIKKEKDELVEAAQECKEEKKSKVCHNRKSRLSPVRFLSINLKASFCNLFRWRRQGSVGEDGARQSAGEGVGGAPPARRALPPLPPLPPPPLDLHDKRQDDDNVTDFATSIHKVKDYGWYWGPISVEVAEEILSNEPDGSFIVRDSSDDHYIFTLTFKLNGLRHVRIEHDQGNFCFGGCTMFKAATIVEFIENAVETSRSGRYLFFLNLRPVLGPVRVQLLYPVSRFKRVQSLQHMCRFVILKYVRRDLVSKLPLPRRVIDYLSATHYYSELLADL